jgi:hypothetical protein
MSMPGTAVMESIILEVMFIRGIVRSGSHVAGDR